MKERSIIDLLYLAKENQIDLFLTEGQLQLKLPKNKIFDKNLLDDLKANKEPIREFLKNNERTGKTNNKISKADRSDNPLIPLSYGQERLWFIDQLEGTVAYHLPTVMRLKGQVNIDALDLTLRTIVERHEVLRSILLEKDGQSYQVLIDHQNWKLEIGDGGIYNDDSKELHPYIQQLIDKPFDLSKDYMLRAHLITLHKQEHILLVTIHHIASDAWSMAVIVKEVVELYSAFTENKQPRLEQLSIQYADYAIWQRSYLSGPVLDEKLRYWKDKLEGTAPLNLPVEFSRPVLWSGRGAIARFAINKKLSTDLQILSKRYESTLFMTLLAAFKILLHRYTGQHDICVGTSVANRTHKEVESLVGFFVNLLALRTEVKADLSFIELLHQVKITTLKAYEHQEVPFEKVVDAVVKQRDISKNPLIQVMFIMLNTPEVPALQLRGLTLAMEELEQTKTLFDISFFINETKNGIEGWVGYSTDLFSRKAIDQLVANFHELLTNISANPHLLVGTIPILNKYEEQRLLVEFNNTEVNYPKNKTIVALFEEQAHKTPAAIALVFEDRKFTYKEINERANQLAHYLIDVGVKPEVLVPVCISRGAEMVIAVLGILKAGGAYVPLDPDYPIERVTYILNDVSASIVVTNKESRQKLSAETCLRIVETSEDNSIINSQSIDNPQADIYPANAAYVIYTSGSTGKPKGVIIEHQNVVRLFKTDAPLYDFNEKDVWTLFHSFSFDFSVWEIFGALLFGGKLVIVPGEVTKDVALFSELILKEKVTVLNQTPSAFYVLQDQLMDMATEVPLRYVIFGGEALNPSKLQSWKQRYKECKLINMYGITETTVHVTYQEIDLAHIANGNSVIGKPIPTLSCYILDQEKNIVPIGVPGELFIGGAGVSRGYLNRPLLTAEKFIKNSFSHEEGGRLYRTGDIGRWLQDGNIEYLGRIDDQVKIRGYRIELGEIESVLEQSGLVSQSVVVAKEDNKGNKRLVGYVVSDGIFRSETIIAYLHEKLPAYMVPAIWMQMPGLPITANGKIDKKALPEPDVAETLSNKFVVPRNETEQQIAEIWKDLLGIDKVGIHDNFFELGGDSIITIQVVSRAKQLGHRLRPKDLFIHQTIAALSSYLSHNKGSIANNTAQQGLLTGETGLLPVQQWYFNMVQVAVDHFNQSVILAIDKTLSRSNLQKAVEELAAQHDALRFKYYKRDTDWVQEYGSADVIVATEDLRNTPADVLSNSINEMGDKYQRSLSIEKGEIIKVVWIQTPATESANRLLMIIHHLAVDGVSWRILLEELDHSLTNNMNNVNAAPVAKGSSYRQWYHALQQYGKSAELLSQITYWQQTANSFRPFATDYNYDGNARVKETVSFTVKLDAHHTLNLVKEVPRVYHTEINDILLCALAKTLCTWSGRDRLVIGLEGHGRESVDDTTDVSRTVGWFTSLYPLLLTVAETTGTSELIKSVKEQLRQVPGKGLGFGVLKYINKEEAVKGRNPWDIQFNYLGQLDNVIKESKWLAVAPEATGAGRNEEQEVVEKLSFNSHIRLGQLVISWQYSPKHYSPETVKGLAAHYLSTLEMLIAHCLEQVKSGTVFTPSDYGLGSSVSFRELDAFLEEDTNDSIMSF